MTKQIVVVVVKQKYTIELNCFIPTMQKNNIFSLNIYKYSNKKIHGLKNINFMIKTSYITEKLYFNIFNALNVSSELT